MNDTFVVVDDELTIFAEKETEKGCLRWIRNKGCLMVHKGEYRIMHHDEALSERERKSDQTRA